MRTAVLKLDIVEYFPQGFNFKGFNFNFKMDKFDETIDVLKFLINSFNSSRKKTRY